MVQKFKERKKKEKERKKKGEKAGRKKEEERKKKEKRVDGNSMSFKLCSLFIRGSSL